MHRRALLASAAIPLVSTLTGCYVDAGPSVRTVSISEPTVRQGDTAIIQFKAPNLTGLSFLEFPDEFPTGPLTLGEATFTPSPKVVWTASPPAWSFTEADVVGEIPIESSPETPADTYQFRFGVRLKGKDEPRSVPTIVTVETDSG